MATEYLTITWDQLHADGRSLARYLVRRQSFKGIVAIARGGLIPAAIIARELNCRLVETISVESYTGARQEEQGKVTVLKHPASAGDGDGYLIVDDLVDTGDTARVVRELLPKAVFACLYAKPDGRPYTDYFTREVPQETWVLFPWDTAPLFVPPLVDETE